MAMREDTIKKYEEVHKRVLNGQTAQRALKALKGSSSAYGQYRRSLQETESSPEQETESSPETGYSTTGKVVVFVTDVIDLKSVLKQLVR